jgi:hypothetical protein
MLTFPEEEKIIEQKMLLLLQTEALFCNSAKCLKRLEKYRVANNTRMATTN